MARGPLYEITIEHPGLHKVRHITGRDQHLVEQKAQAQAAAWDRQWAIQVEKEERLSARELALQDKEVKREDADARTQSAEASLREIEDILRKALDVDDAILWGSLKDHSSYGEPAPLEPIPLSLPLQPNPNEGRYQPVLSFWDRLFSSRRLRKEEEKAAELRRDLDAWSLEVTRINGINESDRNQFERAHSEWIARRAGFLDQQALKNAEVEGLRDSYLAREPDAIEEYCDMVLSASRYPEWCPQDYEHRFLSDEATLVVDYRLPNVSDIPTLKQVRYVASRDTFDEVHIKTADVNKLYDLAVYQICLRTIHELFESDTQDALKAVVFNGWVEYIDRGTGKDARSCILSLRTTKESFEEINLANIDPKSCFRKLKGVGSSALHSMAAVPPLVRLDRGDVRFIAGRDVGENINEGTNLAAISWEDFEHLVREIFGREFSRLGGEVKVTRASRDGGVDAVAFDPDPIRGGKIVIQAKRYTNTVGVSAVRDLYGTVLNEGASKGILVTTATFGPDAYEFAKDKPLTLMSGANLLHLLEKQGQKAYIDLTEAKKLTATS